MIKTTALGAIYLLLLFAFASGIESLANEGCSDWVESCPRDRVTMHRSNHKPHAGGKDQQH